MSDLLSIGASGAKVYRTALDVIGNNVVNAETQGYARRSVVLRESSVSFGTNPVMFDRKTFGGVETGAVRRAWDEYRAADSRMASAAASRSETRVRWLGAAEEALADGATGVGQTVTNVFTAATTLASDPGNAFSRRAFLAAIDTAAGAFRTTADGLSRLTTGIADEADTLAASANADIASLTTLNTQIRRAGAGSASHAQLLDERDRLLDHLSGIVDIETTVSADGSVAVALARSGGVPLVDNAAGYASSLSVARAADGRIALTVFADDQLLAVGPSAGALAGLIESAGNVADRRAQLDTLAAGFATKLNDWSAAGTDANGAAGTALLAFDPAKAASTLAPAVADRDPATVAAALTVDNGDGTTTVTANGNLLALGTARATEGNEQGWSTLVAGQSQILASARSEATATAARRDGLYAQRDEISGIDLDFEASELLRFQQAFNGSAKIIQVARETMQAILDIM